ncbi:MAG TPA: lysylphosphatidylglycerol synthase transmembrane domain-containing protein [Solirubrobacteraceae bacterium]|nr:lysylphosphatidylglycerol synthase transmembrane domain-containing protein [Solirubrobacteraceae bacterium]
MSTNSERLTRGTGLGAGIARRALVVVLFSVAIASLLLAVPGLEGVARQIEHLNALWIVAAVALEFGSCVGFVVIFRLFFDEVSRGPARELAWTEQGAGALLPGGGAGALAIGGWLLQRQGVSRSRVIERSSALFLLTSATNVIALVGAGAVLALGVVSGPDGLVLTGLPIAAGLIAVAAVLLMPILIRRSAHLAGVSWLADMVDGIDGARRALLSSNWRLVGALGYLALDIAALGASFAATGHTVPVAPLVLGYLIGYLANLIPVPGGFGVLEGGLAGALIAYGAPATQAAAAVIVYHAIAFWIPGLGGVVGYWLLQRRQARPAAAITEAPRPTRDGPLPWSRPGASVGTVLNCSHALMATTTPGLPGVEA